MPTYIALLRGINVSGRKPVLMERLRQAFEDRGYTEVRTYVQSGNVVFGTRKASPAALARAIEELMLEAFGHEVPTLVRAAEELAQVRRANPFLKEKGIDPAKLHVTFLGGVAPAAGLIKLAAIASGRDRFKASGSEIYLHCPGGYGGTKLSNAAIERALGLSATTRNWNTVGKLCEMN